MIKVGIAQIGETWVPRIGDESGSFVLYLQDRRIAAGLQKMQEECDRRNAGEKKMDQRFKQAKSGFFRVVI